MYKFTNGIVVFDEETRDKYIQAGYILVKEEKKEDKVENETESKPVSQERPREQKNIRKNRNANWR